MTKRALVLGGGGISGIAWEWGVLAGLAAKEVDLTTADLTVGTSAGSVVGAQAAAGLDVQERYRGQLVPPDGELAGALGAGLMIKYAMAVVGTRTPVRARIRIGRMARRARTVPEAERVRVIESRLPVHEWPDRALQITAVDAESGEFKVFDRNAGVPLVHAVAASCAVPGVWPPVTIDGRRYMDGGIRSGSNADLAAGYDRVVVIAPLPKGFGPMTGVHSQVEALRAQSSVELITPDRNAVKAFGRNILDPANRAASARAGLAQADAVLERIRQVWS
jgi:NTE family protein